MGGDFSAVTVIGAALVAAVGLLFHFGERWNRRKVQPATEPAEPAEPQPVGRTDCDRAWGQQERRKKEEL